MTVSLAGRRLSLGQAKLKWRQVSMIDESRHQPAPKPYSPKFGFAQAVRVYGDNWRAGMELHYYVCGRHQAAEGLRYVERSTNVTVRRKSINVIAREKSGPQIRRSIV